MYKECRHIMPSGSRCHSPALRSGNYCFYHHNLHRLANTAKPGTSLDAIHIEDARGIQIALTQVLSALNSPYMDTRRAGLLLYGLQIASHLTKTASAPEIAESVRTCEEDGGAEIAPEKTVCEPSRDCANCRTRTSAITTRNRMWTSLSTSPTTPRTTPIAPTMRRKNERFRI